MLYSDFGSPVKPGEQFLFFEKIVPCKGIGPLHGTPHIRAPITHFLKVFMVENKIFLERGLLGLSIHYFVVILDLRFSEKFSGTKKDKKSTNFFVKSEKKQIDFSA